LGFSSVRFNSFVGSFLSYAQRSSSLTLNGSPETPLNASSGKNSWGNRFEIEMASPVTSIVVIKKDMAVYVGEPLGGSRIHHIVLLTDAHGEIPPLSSKLPWDNI
jgi:hypothetical protein